MNKKFVGFAVLAMFLVGGAVFAVANCKYYSTNPKGVELGGLSANRSGTSISVSSSITEPVKITSVTVDGDEYVWKVAGTKRLDVQGDTTLTLPSKNGGYSGKLVVKAESCD